MHSCLMVRSRVSLSSFALRSFASLWVLFAFAVVTVTAAVLFFADGWGRERALSELEIQSKTDANLKLALLMAVLERPRALPLVLSLDRQVADVLTASGAGAADHLNRKLEQLVADTQASVIYVIDGRGVTVSASNWRESTSFVGSDYSFRDYFRLALTNGSAEQYALGSVSRRPGLYLSRRIDGLDGKALGVVVAKVEFDQLEANWSTSGRPTYVSDRRGIVLMTSIPSWRFMSVTQGPVEDREALRDSLQFGDAPLDPLPFTVERALGGMSDIVRLAMPGETGTQTFLRVVLPAVGTEWRLQQLTRLEPVLTRAGRESRTLALLALLPSFALIALLLGRRQRVQRRMAESLANKLELERRVQERTLDLTLARDRLEQEITDHRTTEGKLQTVQHELVQANRLAILGQVAAGVAHEINQPVATIRAYADNARTFLARGQPGPACDNMKIIADLTERIGIITEELKAFARKGRASAEPTCLSDVISGAVLLLRSRFSGRLDRLDITLPPPDLHVLGSRIRLEQVLINLLQNALEAIDARPDGCVSLHVEQESDIVHLFVRDNGPGLAPEISDALFTPFNTTKTGGLGLGLVISKDIVTDYGGRIVVESMPGNTCFTLDLKRTQR